MNPSIAILFLLGLATWAADSSAQTPPALSYVDPLVKVFRGDTNLPPAVAESHVAVGEYATFQFVFRSPAAVENLSAGVAGEVPGATARFVGYVKVGQRRCNELWTADGRLPHPLLEDKAIAVAADQNQPVWVTVPAKAPGLLSGKLTLQWKGGTVQQPFTVRVHDVRMKKPRLWVTNWWFSDPDRLAMLAGHKVEPFSIRSLCEPVHRTTTHQAPTAALDQLPLRRDRVSALGLQLLEHRHVAL